MRHLVDYSNFNESEGSKTVRRYFFDTEFIDNGRTIELLSIGIVADDGRELYLENIDSKDSWDSASDWVKENVYPYLGMMNDNMEFARSKSEIADELKAFIRPGENNELWTYYGAYDHVALAQIFGTMMDLPKHVPMFSHDLKQLESIVGHEVPEMDKSKYQNHNALDDARWTKEAYDTMTGTESI